MWDIGKACRRRKGAHCRFARATGTSAPPNLVDGGLSGGPRLVYRGPLLAVLGTATPRAPSRKPWGAVSMSQ